MHPDSLILFVSTTVPKEAMKKDPELWFFYDQPYVCCFRVSLLMIGATHAVAPSVHSLLGSGTVIPCSPIH
jgi:hypothetical protein